VHLTASGAEVITFSNKASSCPPRQVTWGQSCHVHNLSSNKTSCQNPLLGGRGRGCPNLHSYDVT
jgi:hypothetical protein